MKKIKQAFLGGELVPKGVVKWFDLERGFGFILTDDGTDVFFHASSVEGGDYVILDESDKVEFELVEKEKGKPKAINVYRID